MCLAIHTDAVTICGCGGCDCDCDCDVRDDPRLCLAIGGCARERDMRLCLAIGGCARDCETWRSADVPDTRAGLECELQGR